MSFLSRFFPLLPALVPVFIVQQASVSAQTPPKRESPIVRLESIALGSFDLPKWYFLKVDESGHKGIPTPLETSVESRGVVNLVTAPDGHIALFSSPACEATSKVLDIPVDPKTSSLMQLFYLDATGHIQSKIIPEAKEHSSGQIRVINLAGVSAGVSVDKTSLVLKTGDDVILPLKLLASKFFTYQAGWAGSDGSFNKTGEKSLFFPAPGLRMTIVLSTVPSQREKSPGEFETIFSPQDYRFYDHPPKDPPNSSLP